jgi:hypothetical protein
MTTVPTSDYGMHYDAGNRNVIAQAQAVGADIWDTLPISTLPARTPLNACVETLESRWVDRVVSGSVPLRENHPTFLWKDGSGKLYIVDGHARTAIFYALDKPMPVRIMDEKSLAELGDD